ncbi:hypothetical protein B0H16DRAFT_728118 [Mycena metata]|uniref:Uncharacterized protein n=1 Tax=Mycena metata TaxID=1033252 RepID=A0AAD7NYA7_9AGAR|nr:hypothetical protein B0H16DRAFT_728118 [Mycena metata]
MGFILLFVVLSFTLLSFAFTLSLPATIDTGAPVSVQWVRDIGDPTSFGLMQRGLQGGEGILSVTPRDARSKLWRGE